MAPPNAGAIFTLFLILAPAAAGDGALATASQLDEATSARPTNSAVAIVNGALPLVPKSAGSSPPPPMVPARNSYAPLMPPTGSQHLRSTSTTAKPVDDASPTRTTPQGVARLASVGNFYRPPRPVPVGATGASPVHLPHPISDPKVLSYFTTLTSPILPPGADQATLFFASEVLNRKHYHMMSSYLKAISPTIQLNSTSLTVFALRDDGFPPFFLSTTSIKFHIVPEYISPFLLTSLPHHHEIQTSNKLPLMITSNFTYLPDGMTSINMIEVNCSPLYADESVVLYEVGRPLDPLLYVVSQLPPHLPPKVSLPPPPPPPEKPNLWKILSEVLMGLVTILLFASLGLRRRLADRQRHYESAQQNLVMARERLLAVEIEFDQWKRSYVC